MIYFLLWPLPETAMGLRCNRLVGAFPYTHYAIRPSPLCGVKVLTPQKMNLTRPPAVVTAKKQKRHAGCLAHAVRGAFFYSVVTNRRQPNLDTPGIYCRGCGGGQIHFLLALAIRPLITYPFRDGAPFMLLIGTPSTYGRSSCSFFLMLHARYCIFV